MTRRSLACITASIGALVAQLATAPSAVANVDETEAQIESRYGKPFRQWQDYGGYKKAYKHDGYTITVHFVSGVSQLERLMKTDESPISGEEIGHLLAKNSPSGLHWRSGTHNELIDNPNDIQWETIDGKKRFAYYNPYERVLTVTFPVFLEWLAEQRSKGFSSSTEK